MQLHFLSAPLDVTAAADDTQLQEEGATAQQGAAQGQAPAAEQPPRQAQQDGGSPSSFAQLLQRLLPGGVSRGASGAASPPAAEPSPAGAAPMEEGQQAAQQQAAQGQGGDGQQQAGEGSPEQQQAAAARFAAFTYLSQLQQALAYQTAVHQWRRNRGDPAAQVGGQMGQKIVNHSIVRPAPVLVLRRCTLLFMSAGHRQAILAFMLCTRRAAQTMGVLYWQLNDVWQAGWGRLRRQGEWARGHTACCSRRRRCLA